MTRTKKILLTILGAITLVLVGAGPAQADHFSGMDTVEGVERCEHGAGSSGGPATTLYSTTVKEVRYDGSLTLICYFSVPEFVPAGDGYGSWKGDWYAPTRPRYASGDWCFAPGTLSAAVSPGGHNAVPADRTLSVFYRTHGVLTCHWADDPTDEPGYWG